MAPRARPGVSWRIMAYPGVYWRLLAYSGVFWRILVYPGVSWRILSYPGVSRRILAYPGRVMNGARVTAATAALSMGSAATARFLEVERRVHAGWGAEKRRLATSTCAVFSAELTEGLAARPAGARGPKGKRHRRDEQKIRSGPRPVHAETVRGTQTENWGWRRLLRLTIADLLHTPCSLCKLFGIWYSRPTEARRFDLILSPQSAPGRCIGRLRAAGLRVVGFKQ